MNDVVAPLKLYIDGTEITLQSPRYLVREVLAQVRAGNMVETVFIGYDGKTFYKIYASALINHPEYFLQGEIN